ncbi:hypothetical protein REPUB_Repub07fG0006400 [Reevesia pubescens]
MGGHMRSHLAKLPIPPKLSLLSSSSTPPALPSPSALSCDPSSEVNHMQPFRSVNYELSSESESPRTNTTGRTGRRSKRLRKFKLKIVDSPSDSVSSVVLPVSDETSLSSEDAAICLLMLSKDKSTPKHDKKEVGYESLDDDVDGDTNMDLDEDDNDDELFCVTKSAHPKYKCETCNKVFKSHQALGGHRANHKNKQVIRASIIGDIKQSEAEENGVVDYHIHQQRIFKCPFCDKVFQSGQALGGHKKVHFSYLPVAHNKIRKTSSSTVQLFDLNLPASEDDDDEVSLVGSTDGEI